MAILDVPYFQQETDDTCAPACLRMALAFRFPSKTVSETELANRCRCVKGLGCLVDDVYRTARRYKLTAKWLKNAHIEAEVKTALNAGCPVLANVELRVLPYMPPPPPDEDIWHTVLIVGMDDPYVYLHDPDRYHGGQHRAIERLPFFAGWGVHGHSACRL